MPDFRNLMLLRLAALELLRAADPNLAHYCLPVWKPKYYMNRPRILVPRQIEVQRKVEVEGGGGKSAKPVAWSKNQT